jgi:glutamate-1-semialdehyde 2,1-aminomutase
MHEIEKKIIQNYKNNYPTSEEKHNTLKRYMPNGHVANVMAFKPYPLHICKGQGPYVYTHEGNRLLDFLNGYSVLIHGHTDPAITAALSSVTKNGIMFSSPTDSHYAYCRAIVDRVPGIEKVRICNSGTEATLFALRTARAFTQKPKILKIFGGYHGTHDCVGISPSVINTMAEGIPQKMVQDILEVEFNDFPTMERIINLHKDELAAVIVEPFIGGGGTITPKDGYLQFIRELTNRNNILLIFDEIVSFRMNYHGAQGYYGVIPDITTLGKVVGGGFPIGLFGGRADIMNIYDTEYNNHPIHHGGTFFGYEAAMVAGYTALEKLSQDKINYINELCNYFATEIQRIANTNKVHMQINKAGSILTLHYTTESVDNCSKAMKANKDVARLIHLALLNEGIFTAPYGKYYILSTVMTKEIIDEFVKKFDKVLSYISPYIAENFPDLIKS